MPGGFDLRIIMSFLVLWYSIQCVSVDLKGVRIYEKGADMMSRVCVYINSNDILRDSFSVGSKKEFGFRSKLNGNEKLTELSPWW